MLSSSLEEIGKGQLLSSSIYSNVLKAQPERKILMMLTVCYAEYIL